MNRVCATAFVDCLFLLLLVLVLLPVERSERETVSDRAPLLVLLEWTGRADVDLWVKGPVDRGVGYSRPRGPSSSLLRDDRGTQGTAHWELVAGIETTDGEWVVNAHLYADEGQEAPLETRLEVWLKQRGEYRLVQRVARELEYVGHETTLLRFGLIRGQLDPRSMHDEYVEVR